MLLTHPMDNPTSTLPDLGATRVDALNGIEPAARELGVRTDPYEILAIKCALNRLSKKVGKPLLAQLFYRFFRRFPRLALEHRKDVLPNETEGSNSVVIGEPDPRRE